MAKQWILVCLLSLGVCSTARAQAVSPTAHANAQALLTEVNRLKGVLAALNLPSDEQQSYNTLLARAERAAQAEHVYLSLHLLQAVAPALGGQAYKQAKADIAKGGQTAFDQEWRRVGAALTARQRCLAAAPRLPLVVQAIIERSLTQVQPHYQASPLYGQQTSLEYGLFYLGLAKAQLDFVAFCRRLKFAVPAAAPLRSPATALAAMEQAVLDAYRQFDTPDRHSTFIRVNSMLKVAQDLTQERRTSGIWLQTLEARRALTALLVTDAENRSAADLRAQSEAAQTHLAQAGGDQSLGWLYWQMAEAALASDDLKQANAILLHVLPEYFQALPKHALTRNP